MRFGVLEITPRPRRPFRWVLEIGIGIFLMFQKGNQYSKGKGRPPGTGYRAELLKAIGKPQFLELVEVLRTAALAGDMSAMGLLMGRLAPPLKPSAELIRFELPDGTPLDQARAVVAGVAAGQLTPADGKALLDGLAAVCKIQEVTDLIPRLEAIESGLR